MARRILACIGFVFSLVIFVRISQIAWGYIRKPNQVKDADDWLLFLLPPLAAAIAIAVSIAVIFLRGHNFTLIGATWGLFIATQSFLALLAYHLLTRGELVAADGTAYWGKLYLPTLLIGVPISVVGIAAGAVVALALDNRRGRGVRDDG